MYTHDESKFDFVSRERFSFKLCIIALSCTGEVSLRSWRCSRLPSSLTLPLCSPRYGLHRTNNNTPYWGYFFTKYGFRKGLQRLRLKHIHPFASIITHWCSPNLIWCVRFWSFLQKCNADKRGKRSATFNSFCLTVELKNLLLKEILWSGSLCHVFISTQIAGAKTIEEFTAE